MLTIARAASALGKNANCQTLLRPFLPESWTSDLSQLKRAGVPVEYRTARTKPEIALAEIDRVTAAGVRFGCVLADAGYGLSAPFRQGLTGSQSCLGGWHPPSPQGVPGRRASYLARC